jgi:nucleoside-diphosphate-sugar epimerase
MRTLVIGASGFLGTAVVRELAARGHDVVGSSRRRVGYLPLDITDPDACRTALENGGFDSVVNLAGAGVTSGTSNDREMNVVNSIGASVFAGVMSDLATPPWFVHAASSTEPLGAETAESTYSSTKAEGTSTTGSQLRAAGLPHAIVRIHNTYGPGQPRGRFVMDALTTLMRRETFTLNYPARLRDFCFVDDVAGHLADLLERPHQGESSREIGSGQGITLEEAARLICDRAGAPVELVRVKAMPGSDPNLAQLADTSSPDFLKCTTSFRDGIDALVSALAARRR